MLSVGDHTSVHLLADQATNLPDLFLKRVDYSGEKFAQFSKVDGQWVGTSWIRWSEDAHSVAYGLLGLGIAPGDRVAILGPTQEPWGVYDIATQLVGGVSLGIYPKQSVQQVRYILEHSEAKVVIVSSAHELKTVLEACQGLNGIKAIIPWDAHDAAGLDDPRLVMPNWWKEYPRDRGAIDQRIQGRTADDTAIFVYTSGTTGPPKCAMITHGNILSVLNTQVDFIDFYEDDISLSFLPMAHCAERVMAFYGRIAIGTCTAYATNVASVLEELQEVKPTLFGSVPRIFEKAYGRVYTEIENQKKPIQALFHWSVRIGVERIRLILAGRSVPFTLKLKHALADALIFKKIRGAFGGRVRQFLTGAAPIPLPILEFFWAAGLPVFELYGQTEATVVTHANVPGGTRLGTVGKIVDVLEQRIAEDGEVLIRGPFVFAGYFKDPEATAKTIVDGWLHTGDIGRIDDDGYLSITDRKKHIIITAGGKNLTPANIENAAKASDPLISHVHAHGDKRPYVSALVAPSPIETMTFGLHKGLVTQADLDARTKELMDDPSRRSTALVETMRPVTKDPEFQTRLAAAIGRGNKNLAQVERIKRIVILDRDFSQEAGELTPTMKVKRKTVEEVHSELFDGIYAEGGEAIEVP